MVSKESADTSKNKESATNLSGEESADGTTTDKPNLASPAYYLNRELSLLEFQRRVLDEAQDDSNPLLERVKFLAILGSNLDEFFMVRAAGLKQQMSAGNVNPGPDGLTPAAQLEEIRRVVSDLVQQANACLHDELLPALNQTNISIVTYDELTSKQKENVQSYFLQNIFPVLTPLAFDPGHPFPHISNLSLNLAVMIRDKKGEERFARLKVPGTLPQLIDVDRPGQRLSRHAPPTTRQTLIWIDDVISANLEVLFPGMIILESHPFHVTRDAEMEIQAWEAEDLLEITEEGIKQRKFGNVVRLTVGHRMPHRILEILMSNLKVAQEDLYRVEEKMPLSDLKHIASLDRPDLKFAPFLPAIPSIVNPDTQEEDIFSAIRRKDIFLHHPYDSFQPVVNLLNQAARDPDVLAIKMTLYRIGRNSPVVEALLEAIENGKQVAALVELKARFDEESNIEWARALENVGAHVVYGLLGLKVHSKILMIVRREGDTIRRYIHIGTGNYNPVTTHLYTDIGLLTCDDQIGSDITDLFNYLTGYSAKKSYRKLLVAPINFRKRFETLIRREIEHQQEGDEGHLIFKMNSLVDARVIELLYEASQAGVQIDLIIRGMCCLRPGLPGVSENIRVTSIIGRFLEHSRIYYFRNAGNEEIYFGSADLMPRNLDRRVEALAPVEDPRIANYIKDELLSTYLAESVKARIMSADGTYTRISQNHEKESVNSQLYFIGHKPPWER